MKGICAICGNVDTLENGICYDCFTLPCEIVNPVYEDYYGSVTQW